MIQAYALFRTRLDDTIVYAALFLLAKLKKLYPAAKGTPTSPHRLFISSLMLSSKVCFFHSLFSISATTLLKNFSIQMLMDDTYSNKSWTIVTQDMFKLDEVNRMERELFGFLNKNVYVGLQELTEWCQEWCVDDHQGVQAPEPSSAQQSEVSPASTPSSAPGASETPVALIPVGLPASSPPAIHTPSPRAQVSPINTPSREVNVPAFGSSRYNSSSPESSVGLTTPSSPTRPEWAQSKSVS